MTSIQLPIFQTRPTRQNGFSIGVILMAVALLGALGTAVMLASRSTSSGLSDTEAHDRVTAAILINQARNLKNGIASMTAKGIRISSITFDTSGVAGLFNPSIGGTDPQTPPTPDAMWPGGYTWVWKVNSSGNPVVKLYNVGISANPDYVIALPGVAGETCYGVDMILHGYGNIFNSGDSVPMLSAGPFSAWQSSAAATAVDLSASNSGTQGWQEGCFETPDGDYVYIATVRAQ